MENETIMSGDNLAEQLAQCKKAERDKRRAADKQYILKVAIDPDCYVSEQIAFQEYLIRNLLLQVQALTTSVDRLNVAVGKQLNQPSSGNES